MANEELTEEQREPYPFALICEVGLGKMTVDGYMTKAGAMKAAEKLLCCWVLYKLRDPPVYVEECTHGGVGFAHNTIREYADEMFKPAIAAQ